MFIKYKKEKNEKKGNANMPTGDLTLKLAHLTKQKGQEKSSVTAWRVCIRSFLYFNQKQKYLLIWIPKYK